MAAKKKIIFIPADVIMNEVSRSFFFAKYLSEYYDVYFISRKDPQNAYFQDKKPSKFYTLSCFIGSIFTTTKYSKHKRWNYTVVEIPFMSHMIIYRIIGFENALRMCRRFNRYFLNKVAKKLEPDIIFHADGFDLYPTLSEYLNVSDIQDDFDKGNFRDNGYNISYASEQLKISKINFVVSKKAALNLGHTYGSEFNYVPNGVEIDALCNVDFSKVSDVKSSYSLKNKFVISYIGADAWYDKALLKEISKLALEVDPSIHFLIVGNLERFNAPNVSFTGPVSKEESYNYYHSSDVGILFKDSKGSNFLYNSIPLKIIQYGAINKWFVSPPIAWLEEENFNNVKILNEFSARAIIQQILELKSSKPEIDNSWTSYDWKHIVQGVYEKIEGN